MISWPRNIANNEANLREISSKDFGIIELKCLTIAPACQVNDRFGREGLLLYAPFMHRHTKDCLPASHPSTVANEEHTSGTIKNTATCKNSRTVTRVGCIGSHILWEQNCSYCVLYGSYLYLVFGRHDCMIVSAISSILPLYNFLTQGMLSRLYLVRLALSFSCMENTTMAS